MKYILAILSFLTVGISLHGQNVWLHPNNGQWDNEILYSVDLQNGHMYVDRQGFTYSLNNAKSHDHEHEGSHPKEITCQFIKSQFKGSSWSGRRIEEHPSVFYRNYYFGKDESKWRSGIHSVGKTTLIDYYPGIDMILDGMETKLKYSFIVQPGKDASAINYSIDGSEKLTLIDGSLHVSTRFGEIIEEKPSAWTEKDGKKKKVEIEFVLEGNNIHFNFPEGYDKTGTLTIDPYLVFSTFTGATMDNWGMTATPDTQGNLYAGGIVFNGAGSYPTTPGA